MGFYVSLGECRGFGAEGLEHLGPAASTLNGGFLKLRVPFWGIHNKDYSILGTILGSPCLGKLPNGSLFIFHSSNPNCPQAQAPNNVFGFFGPLEVLGP